MKENKIFDELDLQLFNDFEPFIVDGCGEIIIDNFNYKVGNRHYFLSRFGGILITDNQIYHLYRDNANQQLLKNLILHMQIMAFLTMQISCIWRNKNIQTIKK